MYTRIEDLGFHLGCQYKETISDFYKQINTPIKTQETSFENIHASLGKNQTSQNTCSENIVVGISD